MRRYEKSCGSPPDRQRFRRGSSSPRRVGQSTPPVSDLGEPTKNNERREKEGERYLSRVRDLSVPSVPPPPTPQRWVVVPVCRRGLSVSRSFGLPPIPLTSSTTSETSLVLPFVSSLPPTPKDFRPSFVLSPFPHILFRDRPSTFSFQRSLPVRSTTPVQRRLTLFSSSYSSVEPPRDFNTTLRSLGRVSPRVTTPS